MKTEGAAVRISFDHATGLHSVGKLSGFTLAGSDRRFVVAQAKIDQDSVIVSHPDVASPVSVRYGWADCPTCTLYNEAKLPAEPFRTDDWAD